MRDDALGRTPKYKRPRFVCPYCEAFAAHAWPTLKMELKQATSGVPRFACSICQSCRGIVIWRSETIEPEAAYQLIYPTIRTGPPPTPDMPKTVTALYEEARAVAQVSKKSAAGLLRLALQHLVDDLEPGPGDINLKIGSLVQAGLRPDVQRAMDVLRVVGNNAVHPGQINVDDDPDLVPSLFSLIQIIVEEMITRKHMIDELYGALPEGALDRIESRNAKATGSKSARHDI